MNQNNYTNMFGNPHPPVQPPQRPQQPQTPPAWGTGIAEGRPVYLQTWFIALMLSMWFFVVPLIIGIILIIKQAAYDRKLAQKYKTIRDAEAYWAYVKEDCAKIYREATNKREALIQEGKQYKLDMEQKSQQYLLQTDRECKSKKAELEKEIAELLAKRDFLQEEIRQLEDGQMLTEQNPE